MSNFRVIDHQITLIASESINRGELVTIATDGRFRRRTESDIQNKRVCGFAHHNVAAGDALTCWKIEYFPEPLPGERHPQEGK